MIKLEDVRAAVSGHGLVQAVDRVPTGAIRLETVFLYPEGSSVDLFLVEKEPLLESLVLSDLANTMAWLHDMQVKPWLSKKRQQLLTDAIRTYGVQLRGGALELPVHSVDDIVPGVVRLGQSCIRAADLYYTRRSSLQIAVNEDLEEVLVDTNSEFEANVELEGRYGKPIRVDFLVRGTRRQSAILTLATTTTSQAHVLANEVFRKWYDLDIPSRSEQRLTVFDDSHDVYKDDDLRRLSDKSVVIPLSDRTSIVDFLSAAA